MTTQRGISVIIPTYRRYAAVQQLLQAIERQTLSPDEYKVIVSIDGSQDGTQEIVSQFPAPYKLRSTWQPNQGRATACNAGIRLAHGDLLILLDDDMEPSPGFLAAHLQAHPRGSRRAVIGAAPIVVDQSSPPIVRYAASGFNDRLERLAPPGKDFAALARDCIARGRTAVLFAGKHPEVFDDLKLCTYRQASDKWRMLRAALLGGSRVLAGAPEWLIWFVTWLEQRRPARLHFYYHLALDYFYWLGATAALSERPKGHRLTSWRRQVVKPSAW
jgi:glycosyltransferase involved in cell wall biosynthesis